jgi:site-specific DNA recombinase
MPQAPTASALPTAEQRRTAPLRAAIYARYSSENQRDESIDDQVRVCRDRANQMGWTVVRTFADRAASGATTDRPDYQALKRAVTAGELDIVLAESLDRLGRDIEHVASFFKVATFHHVRIHTCAEGDISELNIGLNGLMGSLYLKELAAKTRRGLEGRIHAGRCTGSAPFGYTVVRKLREDGEPDRGLRAIDLPAAAVVRRIFTDYAAGASPRMIARALNSERIPAPGGGIWYDTSIRGRKKRGDGILRNALYVGKIIWRRRLSLKDPTTGARLRRDAKPDTYVVAPAPDLRIIDDALWAQVQARLTDEAARPVDTQAKGQHAFWDQRRPRHLLSGKVTCGICGGAFRSTGKDYLGCSAAKNGACTNRRTVKRVALEAHVLDVLQRQLMHPDLLGAFVAAFNEEWTRLGSALRDQATARERERAGLDRRIANLVDVISDGGGTPAILDRLKDLETKRATLGKAGPSDPPAHQPLAPDHDLAACYTTQIADLTAALARGDQPEALELARSLIDEVIIHPPTDGDPTGIEFIGNLMELLRTAGLGGPPTKESRAITNPRLQLFVSSVKEGPGAEPLAYPGLSPDIRGTPRGRGGSRR